MDAKFYRTMIRKTLDGPNIRRATIYVNDEQSVNNLKIASQGVYSVERLNPEEVPKSFRGRIALRLTKLEKSIKNG